MTGPSRPGSCCTAHAATHAAPGRPWIVISPRSPTLRLPGPEAPGLMSRCPSHPHPSLLGRGFQGTLATIGPAQSPCPSPRRPGHPPFPRSPPQPHRAVPHPVWQAPRQTQRPRLSAQWPGMWTCRPYAACRDPYCRRLKAGRRPPRVRHWAWCRVAREGRGPSFSLYATRRVRIGRGPRQKLRRRTLGYRSSASGRQKPWARSLEAFSQAAGRSSSRAPCGVVS